MPLVAIGIAGLLLAGAVGVAVVVRDDGDDKQNLAADKTTSTTTFTDSFIDETSTTLSNDPVVTLAPDVTTAPVLVAPVTVPVASSSSSSSTSSTVAAPAGPVAAVDPAPCQVPTQPTVGVLGPEGVFTVAVATGTVRVTNTTGRLSAWRPKSTQVASVSVASGKPPGLCLSGPDGAGAKRIVTPVGVGRPAFSFDGARVAVRSSRTGGSDLVVGSVEGTDQKLLLQSSDASDPVWLGDGSAIVTCTLNGGARKLVAIPAGGGEQRVLQDSCPPSPVASSPDGTRVAFARNDQVIVLNVTTRAATNLRIGSSISTAAAPSWSPDGKKLAFAFSDAQGPALGVLDLVAGSGIIRLRSPGLTSPTWAPLGDLIAFVGTEGTGKALITVKTDGTGRRVVAPCQTRCTLSAQPWSPDGTVLVLDLTAATT